MAFPNVPIAPGVPALSRDPSIAIQQVAFLVTDLIAGFPGFGIPQWGIYSNGLPVVVADTVVSLEFRQGWNLSEYPVEQGAFETYNKVATPYTARVRFATGGSLNDRRLLFDSIAAIAGDLNKYDVVMPEAVYTNANIEQYDFRRTASNGLGLVAIDVMLTEVRTNAGAKFQNVQAPGSALPVSGGTVEAQAPTTSQIATGASGSGAGLFF